jgi:hypothetical protein
LSELGVPYNVTFLEFGDQKGGVKVGKESVGREKEEKNIQKHTKTYKYKNIQIQKHIKHIIQ